MVGAEGGSPPVVVVGGGVVGLSVATVLAEAGHAVTVVSADPPEATTSRVAGAVWDSYLCGGPDVLGWAASTYHHLAGLADPDSLTDGGAYLATGVRMAPLVVVARHPVVVPPWVEVAGGPGPLPSDRPDWVAGGFSCVVPTVNTGLYLPYLAQRLRAAGGHSHTRRLDALADLAPCPLVVNCTGIGARALTGDSLLRPVRGQVVVLANPGISATTIDWTEGTDPTYAITHPETVVAGGCAQLDNWSLAPDPATTEAIRARVGNLVPALAGAEVLGVRVGLRPWRPEVRVERDPQPPPGIGRLVHCYGHGGAGVSLSWGSAQAAAALLKG